MSAARRELMLMALVFQGGLLALAMLIGWLAGRLPTDHVQWTGPAWLWGVVATVPMLGLLWLTEQFEEGPLARIKKLLVDLLGPALSECHWSHLAGLAVLAGVSEELLFRGLIQPWLTLWSVWVGVIVTNLLFGVVHAVTPTYVLLAGLMGAYLSWTATLGGGFNVAIPIICHSLYDFVAFLLVRFEYRCEQQRLAQSAGETGSL